MIWTPERIAQARQRNFGESVTLPAQDWDTMLDMAERYHRALWDISTMLGEQYSQAAARKALDGGG